jgi:hypothetical protein
MSEKKAPDLQFQPIDPEVVEKVSGGLDCSVDDIDKLLGNLQNNYEQLIGFTSYVIERVANATK